MKLWDVTLTCDHMLLVAAETAEQASEVATAEARIHPAQVTGAPVEREIAEAGLVVWYPGPWSADAIVDGHAE